MGGWWGVVRCGVVWCCGSVVEGGREKCCDCECLQVDGVRNVDGKHDEEVVELA